MSWPHNGATGIMLMRATRPARGRHWQQQRIERLACLQCTSAGRTAEINSGTLKMRDMKMRETR